MPRIYVQCPHVLISSVKGAVGTYARGAVLASVPWTRATTGVFENRGHALCMAVERGEASKAMRAARWAQHVEAAGDVATSGVQRFRCFP